MTQNSATEPQFSPEEVQNRYGIKKDAYYDRLKFLGLKAAKDSTGKAYISSAQIEMLDQLNEHIKAHGKMEGFTNSNSMSESESESTTPAPLATTTTTDQITSTTESTPINSDPFSAENVGGMDELINLAAGIAAQRLAAPHLVALEIANSMNYDDLPPEFQERVDQARESVRRPGAAVGKLANSLLDQWRAQRQAVTA
jgi:hypothetical protein